MNDITIVYRSPKPPEPRFFIEARAWLKAHGAAEVRADTEPELADYGDGKTTYVLEVTGVMPALETSGRTGG